MSAGNFTWYSPSRNHMEVSVGINGGAISYNTWTCGDRVSEEKRLAVLKAHQAFTEEMERIFLGDNKLFKKGW